MGPPPGTYYFLEWILPIPTMQFVAEMIVTIVFLLLLPNILTIGAINGTGEFPIYRH
jgi:hypothetical protein